MNEEVTVIIPAYNAAKVIGDAVASIQKQTFFNWHLIIVENGSIDDTTSVCESFCQEDSRISLVHSSKGVSNARNFGLGQVKTPWFTFLDADDQLLPEALESLLRNASGQDLVIGQYTKATEAFSGKSKVYQAEQIQDYLVEALSDATKKAVVGGTLFNAQFIKDNHLRFDSDLAHAEDSVFMLTCLKNARAFTVVDTPVYQYTYSADSATRSAGSKLVMEFTGAIEQVYKLCQGESAKVINASYLFALTQFLIISVNGLFNNSATLKEQVEQAKEALNQPVYVQALAEIDLRPVPRSKRMMLQLLKQKNWLLYGLACRGKVWLNRRKG